MIKLSRAGWNNIIIFGVIGFILLINATHDNVFSDNSTKSQQDYLFGEHGVIVALTINQQIKIERIGNSWRAIPATINTQALEQMMLSWQQLEGNKIDTPDNIDPQLGLIVSVELAGQANAVILSIHVEQQQLLLYHHNQQQWYAFALPIYQQLLPDQLFSS